MNRRVAAIDLGSTKVATIVGEETPSGIKIIAYNEAPSKGIVKGEIINIQNVLDSLIPTIEKTKEEVGTPINSIITGISGRNIKSEPFTKVKRRRTPSELISASEIEEMKNEMYNTKVEHDETILHVIPQHYNIDDYINVTEPEGMTGETIEGVYLLFIGKRAFAENRNTVISKAGLALERSILEPIASARAVLTDNEREIGVALVDIGGATTDLIIIKDNIIRYTAVIPFAGNSITEDIKQALGVPYRHAELMKIHFGSCFSGYAEENKKIILSGVDETNGKQVSLKRVSEIIEARVSEIIATVNYEIEKTEFANKIPGGLVFTGSSSNLAYIRHLAKAITGYNIRLAKPYGSISDESCEQAFQPSASTAVGLILSGFDLIGGTEIKAATVSKEEGKIDESKGRDGLIFSPDDVKSDRELARIRKQQEKERREKEKRERREKEEIREREERERKEREKEEKEKEKEKKKESILDIFEGFFNEVKNTDNGV